FRGLVNKPKAPKHQQAPTPHARFLGALTPRARSRRFSLRKERKENNAGPLGAHAAGLANLPAVVGSNEFDRTAHFVEPRADALADALGERILVRAGKGLARRQPLLARNAPGRARAFATRRGGVQIVGRENRDALFVVARVEDVADGLERPRGRFAGPQVIEQKQLSLEHRLKDTELRGRVLGIVASLNLLEQF